MNNDSNNNMFANNNDTSQSNNTIGVNPTPTPQQNELSQINQNISTQPQQQINNNISNYMGNSFVTITPVNANQMPISSQSAIQNNQNINTNIPPQQDFTQSQTVDDDLLKAFIGNNYDKITSKFFNFAGFFFTSLYMFYRKMFGYAILLFIVNLIILNLVDNIAVTLVFNALVGLFVNKIYLSNAKKKISIIKASNPQQSLETLKQICAAKGGTSVGNVFLGLFAEIAIAVVILFVMMIIGIGGAIFKFFNYDKKIETVNNQSNSNDNSYSLEDATLVEDIKIEGASCIDFDCTFSIKISNDKIEEFNSDVNNKELFSKIYDYSDYIKLNIYYIQKGNEKNIVDYKIFLKSNNEDISDVKNEDELRNKIGLYTIGTHTDTFTLSEFSPGFGMDDDNSYTYIKCVLVDSKNIEYNMKYYNPNDTLKLVEGNKYTITFEVSEGSFDYEFTIKSIK